MTILVGNPCLMSANDMLAFVIGTEHVLLGMAEHPDWIRQAIRKLSVNFVEMMHHFQHRAKKTHAFWYGNAGWMPFWAPEPFIIMQSDISCMISSDMFESFIIPDLDCVGRELAVWYHFDGQSALHHLPRLLSLPDIKVMQFVPMAGTPPNGPAYLELYKQIQAAGKIVHIGVPAENVEPLCKTLDPARLMMQTGCQSIREADDLLASAVRWTRA